MANITLEKLKSILKYNPETGKFTWITKGPHFGKEAGTLFGKYERIWISKIRYSTHRLAWFYCYGEWPGKILEHKSGDYLDNRIKNLKEHISFKITEKENYFNTIKKHIRYNAETGEFSWIIMGKGKKDNVGVIDNAGYHIITVCGKACKAHRLAWLLTYRALPKFIDHINGNKSDNRLCNLRETTIRENGQNRKEHRNGRMVGVTQSKSSGKWKAQVNVDGNKTSLGTYKTELEAHKVYINYLIINNLPCRSSIICS